MKKVVKTIAIMLCTFMFVWSMFSWTEIAAKNNTQDPQYSKYNLFVLLFPMEEEKDAVLYDNSVYGIATFITNDGNTWKVYVDKPPAAGAYKLTFNGDEVIGFRQK